MELPSIRTEVRKIIADRVANNEPVQIPWITQEVLDRHHNIEGDDRDFYLCCARYYVKEIVRACIGKYDAKSGISDPQLVLAGFEHLQVAYTVTRNNETVLIPVDQLTDAELRARADEYDEMAKGVKNHALEIRKYVESRGAAAAA